MGWGFRRSVTIGGLRFTSSKTGFSASIGRKGLRLTNGPRGVWVTTGASGFYYRQRLGRVPRPKQSHSRPKATSAHAEFSRVESFASARIGVLSDVTQEDFVRSLNEWTTRGAIQVLVFIVALMILAVLLWFECSSRAMVEAASYLGIGFLLARYIETRRRRFLLIYDIGSEAKARSDQFTAALAEVAQSRCLRAVRLIGHHDDWKRNGGATRSLSFAKASLRRAAPKHIVSNVLPYTLATQGMELSFLPDRILVRRGNRFAAISYTALQVEVSESNFIWDQALPGDAQVVGETWLYVRRDGGPDRRFSNNRRIPIVRVAYLSLSSPTGLEIVLQMTRLRAGADFVAAGREQASGVEGRSSVSPEASLEADVQKALQTLGLTHVPTAAALRATYRELAQRSHPDKFGNAAHDIRSFAEERMKEINVAYEALLPHARPDETPSEHLEPTKPAASSPMPWWRVPEAVASGLACTACLAFFLVFRAAAGLPPTPAAEVVTAEVVAAPIIPKAAILHDCPVRERATPGGRRAARVSAGALLDVLEKKNGWRRVRLNDGTEGWTGPACWR